MVAKTRSGSGRSGTSTEAAPTRAGKKRLLPRPKAKDIFEAEKVRSSGPRPKTPTPTQSAAATKSAWECTTAFGCPVEPEV